jgi:hypothetical protein
MFFIGQRVLCTNDRNWPDFSRDGYVPTLPKAGAIYTVREIMLGVPAQGHDEDGLWLAEIVNQTVVVRDHRGGAYVAEIAFRMSRFRPLRATNIDIFLEMLAPVPAPAELVE